MKEIRKHKSSNETSSFFPKFFRFKRTLIVKVTEIHWFKLCPVEPMQDSIKMNNSGNISS